MNSEKVVVFKRKVENFFLCINKHISKLHMWHDDEKHDPHQKPEDFMNDG